MADDFPGANLPTWHAINGLRAAPIQKREADRLILDIGGGQSATVKIPPQQMAGYNPVPGDYCIVFPDGHAHVLPKQTFEAHHRQARK